MIIKNNVDSKTMICSICRHAHTINNNGSTTGEPFEEYYRKIKTSEPAIEHTNAGTKICAKFTEHTGYTCPKCNTLQIVVAEA